MDQGVSASFHEAAAALLSKKGSNTISLSHKMYTCPWMAGAGAGKDGLEWLLEKLQFYCLETG